MRVPVPGLRSALRRKIRVSPRASLLLGKMSRRTLAKKAGLTAGQVSLVLRGKRGCSMGAAARMARALGMSLDKFYLGLYGGVKRQKKGSRGRR